MRTYRPTAFTLVELLIVVLILGLLAAVVLAYVTKSTEASRRVSVENTVREVCQAIELFRQYTGEIPDLISNWDPIESQVVVNGVTVGPMLSSRPRNLLADGNQSCITDGNEPVLYTDVCAFQYDYDGGNGTGRFIASLERSP
jgi:prepilin-type N-terminal cleavage/methylation domain-containing protein